MPKKLIFTIVGLILIAELIWGGWSLTRKFTKTPAQITTQQTQAKSTISLKSSKNSFKIGENIPVTIELFSGKVTDGADIILTYDPKKLQIIPASTKVPVAVGNLYNDYPINKVDESTGYIFVSGITSQANGVMANGVFGTISFKAKAAGSTKISVNFTPNSTVDSNIIENKSAKDLLIGVKNLEVNIIP